MDLESNHIMHNLATVVKAFILLCITWFTEIFIGAVVTVQYIPANVREFFDEIKTPLACIASFVVIILTVIKILKENKK